MAATEWKSTYLGVAARSAVATHFLRCLRMLDAGMLAEAKPCFARRAWREGIDLTGVPNDIIEKTEALCASTRYLFEYRDEKSVRAAAHEILDLWS